MTVVEHELFDTAIKLIEKGVSKDVVAPSIDKDTTTLVDMVVDPGVQVAAEELQVEYLPVTVVYLANLVRWVVVEAHGLHSLLEGVIEASIAGGMITVLHPVTINSLVFLHGLKHIFNGFKDKRVSVQSQCVVIVGQLPPFKDLAREEATHVSVAHLEWVWCYIHVEILLDLAKNLRRIIRQDKLNQREPYVVLI